MNLRTWINRHYVALAALFVALGGTAYAATAPKGSVTSKSIKNGAVRSVDIKNNGVKGIDIDEASLDFRGLKQLVGPRGEPGTQGPAGPTFATSMQNGPVPPATPDSLSVNGRYTHTFVTPVAGRLLTYASLDVLGVDCTAGHGNAFLYLDGVGVPASGHRRGSVANASPFRAIAVSDVVPAGQHTLTIALDCPNGNKAGDTSSGDGNLGAVLIGG